MTTDLEVSHRSNAALVDEPVDVGEHAASGLSQHEGSSGGEAIEASGDGTDAPGPRRSGRLLGIDIARAIALMGMFTQHVSVFGADGEGSTGLVNWVFTESAGRASVLFFVLSGVSLSIIAGRDSASASDGALRKRGFLLLTGGILLTTTLWPASILQHYGLAFLLAPWLLRLGRRGLAAATGAGLIGGPVLLLFATNWTDDISGIWSGRSGAWLIENVWDILISGIYPMVLWIGFFTFGMLIGRVDLGERKTLLRLLAAAVVATIGFGLIAAELSDRYGDVGIEFSETEDSGDNALAGGGDEEEAFDESLWEEQKNGDFKFVGDESKLDALTEDGKFGSGSGEFSSFEEVPADWRSLYEVAGHSGRIGWTMQTGALAVAVMAFALLIPSMVTTALKPLAWMGSMSLTAYVVHILLVTDVYDRFVSEADWTVVDKELAVLGLIGVMIALCAVFKRLFKVGPLEWLLKQFTVASTMVPGRR